MTTATKKTPAGKTAAGKTAAGKTPAGKTPARKPPARKTAEKGTLDYLELALENLNKAREHAQKDARGQIDATVERIRETIKDVAAEIRRRAHQGD